MCHELALILHMCVMSLYENCVCVMSLHGNCVCVCHEFAWKLRVSVMSLYGNCMVCREFACFWAKAYSIDSHQCLDISEACHKALR